MSKMVWLPLESNPEVMNKFLDVIGVPDKWNMVDIFGTDPEALAWVPKPVLAVILLFPCSEKHYDHAQKETEAIESTGQEVSKSVYFMKQYVSNACGTIALIHSIGNNADKIELKDGPFKEMFDKSLNLTPEERGQLLQDGCGQIMESHQELAQEGQSHMVPPNEVNHHFIAFIHRDGHLYELDGRRSFPINHGPSSQESLLEDSITVCKKFIERDVENVNFTMMALTARAE